VVQQSVKPLRVVVLEVKLRPGRQALMLGYILYGNLRVGDELTIAPLGCNRLSSVVLVVNLPNIGRNPKYP
jgi:hypothetical protein